MKNSLFIAATPFQIVVSALVSSYDLGNQHSDLCIVDEFDYESIIDDVRMSNVFDNVMGIREQDVWRGNSTNLLMVRLKQLGAYFNCTKIVKKTFSRIMEYTDIYISSRSNVNRLVCMFVAENTKASIHYYDDGIAAYTGIATDIKKLDKLLRKIIVGREAANFAYDKYLFCPALYRKLHPESNENVFQIMFNKNLDALMVMFAYSDNCLIEEPAVLFDTVLDQAFTDEGAALYKQLVKIVMSNIDCIIKKHPREKRNVFKGKYFKRTDIPFEVMCYKQDYSSKILITNFSTAVFMPKILYNQEPRIIFLHKIIGDQRREVTYYDQKIVNYISDMYEDASRIMVPESVDELTKLMSEITKVLCVREKGESAV